MFTFIEFLQEKAPKARPVKQPAARGSNLAGHEMFSKLPVNHHEDEIHRNRLTPENVPDKAELDLCRGAVYGYAHFPSSVSGATCSPGSKPIMPQGHKIVAGVKHLLHNPATRIPKDLGPMTLYHGMRFPPQFDEHGHIFVGNSAVVSTSTQPHKAMGAARLSKHVGPDKKDGYHMLVIHHPNDDDHHAVSIHNVTADNGARTARKESEVLMPPTVLKFMHDDIAGFHPDDDMPVYVHHVRPVLAHPAFTTPEQDKRSSKIKHDLLYRINVGGDSRFSLKK